jgi:hypothetical protein
MLDQRALAPIDVLGLTEARVRGAIRVLERVGFLERMPASGRTHQSTPDGLHRKPVLFLFGAEYGPLFSMANKRAAAARERRLGSPRISIPTNLPRPSAGFRMARRLNSPKHKDSEAEKVLMGEITTHGPHSSEPPLQTSALDTALDRWKLAFEKAKATR